MLINQLVDIFTTEFSTHSILNMVSRISQYHRIQGSQGYLEAAKYLQEVLEKNNIETKLYEFPADGKWEGWGWISPISWDIKSGECWITKPVKKRLCRFSDCPMSVITHSKAADFEATLVDIGKGDKESDYEIAKGKVALITTSPRKIFSLAAKHDVKGLILCPNLDRAAQIGDFTTQYDGFWPIAEDFRDVTSGFSISHKQARELKKLLEEHGEVKVSFKIDAHFSLDTGKLHVLETEIVGTEKPFEEIVVICHLCHPSPSANDNASGSATALEMVLCLKRLIKSGVLVTPKRTIRFLWVPEFSGTIPWLKKNEILLKESKRKMLAVFNLDMVGQSPEKIGTPLTISSPSLSTPSYLRSILKHASECVAKKIEKKDGRLYRLNYTFAPFEGGSDQLIFNDRYFSIPSVMFGHEDPFHHTSADSIEKVDEFECRSVGIIVGSVAYGIANSDKDFLNEAISLVFLDVMDKIFETENRSYQSDELSNIQKLRQCELLEDYGLKRIKSVDDLDQEAELIDEIDHFSKLLQIHLNLRRNQFQSASKGQETNEIGKAVAKRNYTGPLPIKRLMRYDRSDYDRKKLDSIGKDYWGGAILELLNLTDGKTTIEEIFLLLKIYYPNMSYSDVIFIVNLFIDEGILIEETSILSNIEDPIQHQSG